VQTVANAKGDTNMLAAKKVSLFRNGANQAVRIPKEFELQGKEAMLRREGDSLILEAIAPKSLLQVLAGLEQLEETFPDFDDPKPETFDL
jgi:antitoxin VapB